MTPAAPAGSALATYVEAYVTEVQRVREAQIVQAFKAGASISELMQRQGGTRRSVEAVLRDALR